MTKLYADEALYALLCKYVLGEADTAERQWVDDWLRSDPDHPVLLSALEKLLTEQPRILVTPADTERAWQSLSAQMNGGKTVSYNWRKWWMAAAVILIAAGTGLWWVIAGNNRTQRFTGPVVAQLKDGTTVQLEDKAQLLVLAGFERKREVSLEGKAVFDVTPDADRPFIVKLGERTIKVLGTRFMVDVAGKKGALRIHVDTGQIMVMDKGSRDSVVLSAGMLLEQREEQVPFRIASHVADAAKQQLIFTDTPLSEVLQTIEMIYHLQVTADAALLTLPVTATFTGETADNVLASIAFMTNADMEKKDTVVILKKHED